MDLRTDTALCTDLYELTMAAAYFRRRMFGPATFSLFIREYPPNRGFLVSAGLEDVIDYLERFRYSQTDLEYLDSLRLFPQDFLRYLEGMRFTGDMVALQEGRLFFRDEPILEVTAPIIEAQVVETFILNAVNLQTSIATKAARCVHAAQGRRLVDFSLRRTHGPEAGLKVARASFLAGFHGTSNVLAGKRYGIPVAGTMAHSFVTSFEDETEAFRAFAEAFPGNTVLLIDTYDTVAGARKAAVVGREMAARGESLRGVRLDSGDMAALSREVRGILREAGLDGASIFASGGFDEGKIARALAAGGEIDAFGVGTKMGVSADAPYTDIAYKLVQYDGRPVLKLSAGKKTLAGAKQVFRAAERGALRGDTIALRGEELPGEALLRTVMRGGQRLGPPDALTDVRERFREEFSRLPEPHKRLEAPAELPVHLSAALRESQEKVIHDVREKELGES
ncbi:MAG: nicotinate phosphoribosyltransferase [Deferrisomatales bacterium]|nr:nicotinate phosphoribosyltransferase [Deferrisomatales bacterium]